MSGEEFWGVFLGGEGGTVYLEATTQSLREAQELARELDAQLFQDALEDYEEFGDVPQPAWEDFDGLHFIEPVSGELAAEAADQLARGYAVRVE